MGIFFRVGRIDAVDFGRFEQHVGLDLPGPQGGRRVGRDERAAGPGRQDHDPPLFKMPHAAATDERLGHAFHADGRLQPRRHADLLQGILQRQAVDHRGQHPHVMRGRRIDGRADGGELAPAENVPAAADDRQLHAHPMHHAGDLAAKWRRLPSC